MEAIVRIEFQRVQTFLFAVPRLADIVGANALLGETLRYELPKLACKNGCRSPALPQHLSRSVEADPLPETSRTNDNNDIQDNPEALWEKGILSRDGGHFRAYFDCENKAKEFAQEARDLLRKRLPGLRCEIKLDSLRELENSSWPQDDNLDANSIALFSLPILQHCEESGNGSAVKTQHYPNNDKRAIGLPAQQRKEHWQRFKNNQTDDIAAFRH